uniref:hypothetical protein n=1 Tax=Chromobacterium amazonense TaxID=1382803 RepID=UPI003F7B2B3D
HVVSRFGFGAIYQSSDWLRLEACEGLSESAVIEKYLSIPFLVLDDFDLLWGDGYGLRVVRHIVRKRIYGNKKTVLVSNQNMAGLASIFGEDFISMAARYSVVVECDWGDYRQRSIEKL